MYLRSLRGGHSGLYPGRSNVFAGAAAAFATITLLAACGSTTPAPGSSPATAPTTASAAVSATTAPATNSAAQATPVTAAKPTAATGSAAASGATPTAGTSAASTTPAATPATSTSGASTTPAAGAAAGTGGTALPGRQLYVSKGCVACHGQNAEGNIGPKTAGTGLTFAEVLHQVRQPRGQMPPFSVQAVSDAEVQQIYDYLESLAPATPTAAPAAVAPAGATPAPAAVNVAPITAAVNDLKTASDYAKDASKTPADLKGYSGQAAQALQAAQTATSAAIASGGGGAELKADLTQLKSQLDAIAPDVHAAASATTLADAAPHTAKMVLASRIDLLPLALELIRVNGDTGSISGTLKDTGGKPLAQAFVTIEGGKTHVGLMTNDQGAFQASGIAAFRAIEVKAYKAGYLYVESHAPVTKRGTANVTITVPAETNAPASPVVSNAKAPAGPVAGNATATFSMQATQKDNRIADDQLWALSPEAGVAYVLRGAGSNAYSVDQALPGLKAGSYTWYFFATTHECEMSNVMQQKMTVQ